MAKKNNINNSALAKLCSYVVLASQQQGILDNLNIADDKTYSSKHIKDLIDNISEEDRKYAENLFKNLNSLSSKKIDEQPTDLNTQPNTMYFWNENGDGTTFKQYLRLDDELLYLGSTADINLDGYLLESDADDKFETIANVQLIKDVLGDTTQLETSTIMGDLEKAKESDGLIPVTKAQHNELVTNGSTTINGKVVTYDVDAFYVITDDENSVVDMSQYLTNTSITTTIDDTSTDVQIPSAKTVNAKIKDRLKNADFLFSTDSLGISIEFNKEYTLEKSMYDYTFYDGQINWKQTCVSRRSWYNNDWDILNFTATDASDTLHRIYTLRLLIKHTDGKIIKFLTSNYISFNLSDGSFSTANVTTGINIFALR